MSMFVWVALGLALVSLAVSLVAVRSTWRTLRRLRAMQDDKDTPRRSILANPDEVRRILGPYRRKGF